MSEHIDPRTGDTLSDGEWVSWQFQHVLRRWPFLIATQVITLVCWIAGAFIPLVLVWWNVGASDLAIIIEGITAMALINQTIRDAVVNRSILKDVRQLVQDLHAKVDAQSAQTAQRDATTGRYVKKLKTPTSEEMTA